MSRLPFTTARILCICLLLSSRLILAQDIVTTITASPITIITGPSSTPPSPQYTSSSVLKSAVLNSTNTYRKQHDASALTWNDTLAEFAEAHVKPCKFAHTGGPYGENLAEGYPDITASVDGWGDERQEYNYGDPGFSEATGHFTQLVWQGTTSTGCGVQDCGTRGWLLFCEYSPAGNVLGQFAQNVVRPGTTSPAATTTKSTSSAASPSSTSTSSSTTPSVGEGGVKGYVIYLHAKMGSAGRTDLGHGSWLMLSLIILLAGFL